MTNATIELLDVMSQWHYKKWSQWKEKAKEGTDKKLVVDMQTGHLHQLFEIHDYDLYCHFCFAYYVWPVEEQEFEGGKYGVALDVKNGNRIERF